MFEKRVSSVANAVRHPAPLKRQAMLCAVLTIEGGNRLPRAPLFVGYRPVRMLAVAGKVCACVVSASLNTTLSCTKDSIFGATLNGAPVYTDSSKSYSSTRVPVTYTLTFQSDSAADVLQISYTIKSLNTGGNSNVDLQAVTVIAPEPMSLAVVGVMGTMWGLRRRGRRA